MLKILAPAPTLTKGVKIHIVFSSVNKGKIIRTMKNAKREKESYKAPQCRNYSAEKLIAFPFPGQLAWPCRHAAPLSHTFSSMFHCPCMFDVLHKESERHKHIMQAGNRCLLTA